MIRRRAMTLVTAGALGATLLLAGCGGSGDADQASGADEPVARSDAYSLSGGGDGAAPEDGAKPGSAGEAAEGDRVAGSAAGDTAGDAVQARPQQMIRTAQLELRVADLPSVAVKVRAVATGLGGYVSSEETSIPPVAPGEPRPDATASILLRVPEARFDQALSQVSQLGVVLHRTSGSQDVTAEVTDLDSRVKTQRASVDRVRALMAQAKELKDIVLLESELSRRQADLEALESKLKTLSNQAALSTITVVLDQPGTAEQPEPEEETGILHALAESWDALVASLLAVLTALAVLLPWVGLAALVGLVVLLARRRFPRSRFGRPWGGTDPNAIGALPPQPGPGPATAAAPEPPAQPDKTPV